MCTVHSAAQIAHDWTVERLACLLGTVSHVVKMQFKAPSSRGSKLGDIAVGGFEIAHYLHHAVSGSTLVTDLLLHDTPPERQLCC